MRQSTLSLGLLVLAACQGAPSESETAEFLVRVSSPTFPTELIGVASPPQTITISPPGGSPFSDDITAISSSCGAFTVSAPGLPALVDETCEVGCPGTPQTICPVACIPDTYDTYSFTATFTPNIAGTITCTIYITGTQSTTLTVSGMGMAPPIEISVSPGSVAFGDVRRNTASTPVGINVASIGGSTLSVSSVSASAGFTITSGPTGAYNLAPGGSQPYMLECNPTATGAMSGSFVVTSDDPSNPTVTLPLSCNGIDSNLSIAPSPATIPTTRVGEPLTETIDLSNTGTASMTLESVTFTGTDMTLLSAPSAGTVLAAGGGAANAQVSFAASTAESVTGSLVATYDGGQTRTVAVTGQALATAMSVNPDGMVDFGPVCAGQTKDQTFTVIGDADGSFVISALSTPDAPFTVMAPTLPASVAGGGANMVTFDVIASPTAVGAVQSQVTVTTDIPGGSPDTIALAVEALDAGVTPSPDSVYFGVAPVQTTTIGQQINLSNCSTTAVQTSNPRIVGPNANEFAIVSTPPQAQIAANGAATWLVVFEAQEVGNESATFMVDYDGGTASVALTGDGAGSDAGSGSGVGGEKSYYTCSAGHPASLWPIVFAIGFVVRRRRRR